MTWIGGIIALLFLLGIGFHIIFTTEGLAQIAGVSIVIGTIVGAIVILAKNS